MLTVVDDDIDQTDASSVEYAMATVFATALIRDTSLSSLMSTQYDFLIAKARSTDSQQQTTRAIAQTRFLTERRS